MRICVRCNKFIGIRENYFEVIEWDKKKVISKKYVHKNCQNEYDKFIKENIISPEAKQKMAKALVQGFKRVKQIQERTGMIE